MFAIILYMYILRTHVCYLQFMDNYYKMCDVYINMTVIQVAMIKNNIMYII